MNGSPIDVRVDVGGTDVQDLVWGAPLPSVSVRQWVTFTVFALVLVATAARFPTAGALERYLLAPLMLVALLFTVLSLFIVRGTVAIRRREGMKKLGAALVEHGIVRLDEIEAVRTTAEIVRRGPDAWCASAVIDRDGALHDLLVDGDAGDEARVRLQARPTGPTSPASPTAR